MDYSKVPVARRTRSQKILLFREFKERMKAEESGNGGKGGFDYVKCEIVGSSGNEENEKLVSIGSKSKKIRKGSCVDSKKKHKTSEGEKNSQNVVVVCDDGIEVLGVVDPKEKPSPRSGVYSGNHEQFLDVLEPGVDCDESEGEVEFLGAIDSSAMVDSNSSCLGKEPWNKGREEFESSSQKRGKTAGLKITSRETCGVWNQAQSRLGVLENGEEVLDDASIVSGGSEELNEEEDVSSSDSANSSEPDDSSDSVYTEESESSSDEDSNDHEYKIDDVSVNLDDSSSFSRDEKEDEHDDESSSAEILFDAGLKKRKICGLDVLVNAKDCESEEAGKNRSVAERLRPRRGSKSTKSKKKKDMIGTFSHPITLTDEELGFLSEGEDGRDGDETTCYEVGNNRKHVQKGIEEGKKGRRNVGRPASAVGSSALLSAKILADSIWKKGDVPLDGVETLPLRFCFEDEDMESPERSHWDIVAEELFAEMDFAMAACDIGNSDSSVLVENEDNTPSKIEDDPATCCHQGNHHLVLDEEIGLRCTFCSFVKLEIKHILPSLIKNPCGRTQMHDFDRVDHFNVDALQFEDFTSAQYVGHVHADGTVWDIVPGIRDSMYPHQREGFEFIWQNVAGSICLEKLKNCSFDGGRGCIISHAPGTGKTRLTIVFLQAYMQLNPECRPVIIAPRTMLLTWEEEFRKWNVDIPFHILNSLEFSGGESVAAIIQRKKDRRGLDKNAIRLVKLYLWRKGKSVLGMSYKLFEQLAGVGALIEKGGKRTGKAKHLADVRKMLLEDPDLLVLDEGHTPRNRQSLIWKAFSEVETQRRVILSGTPFQNNFDELLNTLCLVRPKFADEIIPGILGNFKKRGRICRALRREWTSLTNSIAELKAKINPFVHVHKGTILKEHLPGLRDSLIVLAPTKYQKDLMEAIHRRKNRLEDDHAVSLISVHPSLLLYRDLVEKYELFTERERLERLRLDPQAGVKSKFLTELIRLSGCLKEKVLVFSQYIDTLKLIKEQLEHCFDWTEGDEILYMDGTRHEKHRQSSINLLNDPASEVRVLLASTRACSEGINLVGASRVLLLDVVWNPSVERQAISRAYRLGQKKVVYVYHLIAGVMELEKYVKQAGKDRLSELVFSSTVGVQKPESACLVAEDKILQEMVQHESMSNIFEKILDQPKESNLIDTFG